MNGKVSKSPHKPRTHHSYHVSGASFLEALLTLPLLLAFCVGIVDFARYCVVQMGLNYAAFTAADFSSKNAFEIDTRSCASENELLECQRYLDLFRELVQRGTSIAHTVASPSNGSSMVVLNAFEHYYAGTQVSLRDIAAEDEAHFPTGRIETDLAFMRPGEKVRRVLDTAEIDHPTKPFGTTGSGSAGWPGSESNWAREFESHPLVVRVEARMRFFFPFFSEFTVSAQQEIFRRTRAFGVAIPPAPGNTPFNWDTPTPSPTSELPEGTAVPVTSPTVTPIPGTPTVVPPTATPNPHCASSCTQSDCNPMMCFSNPPSGWGCGGCNGLPQD